jgi:hypothetical protein
MANGINDKTKLAAALQPAEITFRQQAEWWLSEIRSGLRKCRQRNKRGQRIRQTTLDAYTTAVAYLNEKIGEMRLAAFDNAEMRDLIAAMEEEKRKNGQDHRQLLPCRCGCLRDSERPHRQADVPQDLGSRFHRSASNQQTRAKRPPLLKQTRSRTSFPVQEAGIGCFTLYWQAVECRSLRRWVSKSEPRGRLLRNLCSSAAQQEGPSDRNLSQDRFRNPGCRFGARAFRSAERLRREPHESLSI